MTGPDVAYTRQEAADKCRVSLTQIDRAIAAGELKAKRPSPRRVVILVSELNRWLASKPDA